MVGLGLGGGSGCYMLDFSVYKPPAELKVNNTTGSANAKQWKVRWSAGAGGDAISHGHGRCPGRAAAPGPARGLREQIQLRRAGTRAEGGPPDPAAFDFGLEQRAARARPLGARAPAAAPGSKQ